MMRLELLCLVALLGVVLADKCGVCHIESCKKPKGCVAGLALDTCSCCEVCAKSEYEMCDLEDTPDEEMTYGRCGENLECRLRQDLLGNEGPEALCYCTLTGALCGSDGNTYKNACSRLAASMRSVERNEDEIKVEKEGPCEAAPEILTPPENMKNNTGEDVTLSCEATGFPIPTIEWIWSRVDGKNVFLPSDDVLVAVNLRGGPEKNEMTGWMQIMGVKKEHEGDYTCVAQNKHGVKQATARVIVVEKGDNDKYVKDEN